MTNPSLDGAIFRKSSRSGQNGDCVEVATNLHGIVAVRDTKDKGHGPVLIFTPAEWDAFVGGTKDGEFDI